MRYWRKLRTPPERPGPRRGAALLLMPLLCAPLSATASEVEVRLAYARASVDQWLVTTRVDFELDAEAEQLVRQGLRLRVEVEFAVSQPRPVITSRELASFVRTLYLEYDAESERFVVGAPSADARTEFATMFSALRKIGYLADQPVIEAAALEPGQAYVFTVQARMYPETASWWSRNVTRRLGLGLNLSSATYSWQLTP